VFQDDRLNEKLNKEVDIEAKIEMLALKGLLGTIDL